MAHWSENAVPLSVERVQGKTVQEFCTQLWKEPAVFVIWIPRNLPFEFYGSVQQFAARLHSDSVVCILTSPHQAADILPYLEAILKFQLWVAVKTPVSPYCPTTQLPNQHAALLVLSRYRGALRHTKTRIAYTYCPAYGRTTKDYGGKKHVYHEYGTLMSDVWRDIEIDISSLEGIRSVINRISDLFGMPPYRKLYVLHWQLDGVHPAESPAIRENLFSDYSSASFPLDSQLIHGDCIESLRSLPDDSVDFCFADPPYNLRKKYDHWNDAVDSREYFEWCDRWLAELIRVLKPGRTLAILNIPLWAVRHYQFLKTQLRFQNWIVGKRSAFLSG